VAALVFSGFRLRSSSIDGRKIASTDNGLGGAAVAQPAKGSDPDVRSKLVVDGTDKADSASSRIETLAEERSDSSDESLSAKTESDGRLSTLILSPSKSEEVPENKKTIVRGGGEGERNPDFSVEVEKAAMRAYPADVIPFQATLNAQQTWSSLKSKSKNSPGTWELIGPSKATYPGVLNAIGDGDQTVVAGRVTAMAIGPSCSPSYCPLYVGAAGGGIWRTTKALAGNPKWEFVSGSFLTNAIGSLIIDPNDSTGKTLYAGTGEANASADSEAGMGIYKTTNGGNTWTLVPGSSLFQARAVSSMAIDGAGNLIVGIASAVRGVSSVSNGGAIGCPTPTGCAVRGVYRQTGATFTLLRATNIRGTNQVAVDPNNPNVLYQASFAEGVWRSVDNGVTWTQIKTPLNGALSTDRAEFAINKLPGGFTRMYVGVGNQGVPAARFYRTDDAAGAAVFADMTTPQNINYCTAQCWYDNKLESPAGNPNIVYLLGSYDYTQRFAGVSNGRAVLLSTDGGLTWGDMTWDSDPHNAEAIHPDLHALVTHPNDPLLFFPGSDGGVMVSDGRFADSSSKCDERGLSAANNAYCKSLLSRVPNQLYSLNEGFSTLQYQSFSVSSQRPKNNVQGGTQDNGTFQYTGSSDVWWQEIYGDGGQSGFSSADDSLRFNTFTGQANDVNFRNGDPTKWCVATGPIVSSPEASYFYPPITADPNPANWGTIFQGSFSVWRTQDWGGPQAYLEANCPEFTTSAANPACGDFVRIGVPGTNDLTSAVYGTRAGAAVAAIERAPSNTGTLWVATGTGRLFISDNSDAPAATVVWNRLDNSAANSPGRFITSIYVDPLNPNRAWVSYSGYNLNTPGQPGHVFEVLRTGPATATWTNLDGGTGPMGDLPVTDLVRDDVTGTLYASTDFGVLKYDGVSWTVAGTGLPMVEVPGLTIVPSERILYAATHGRSGWKLTLP
jgi:hypothetical protein